MDELGRFLNDKRLEIVALARTVVDRKIHLIEGVRQICAIIPLVGQDESRAFLTLRAVESDTDSFPLGEMRTYCATEYLLRMDAELNDYLPSIESIVFEACHDIIRDLSE